MVPYLVVIRYASWTYLSMLETLVSTVLIQQSSCICTTYLSIHQQYQFKKYLDSSSISVPYYANPPIVMLGHDPKNLTPEYMISKH